jgi:hypothetical protein
VSQWAIEVKKRPRDNDGARASILSILSFLSQAVTAGPGPGQIRH